MLLRDYGPWSDKRYLLDKMSLRELVVAFFTYYSIQAYLALFAVASVLAFVWSDGWLLPLVSAGLMVVLYPLIEYLLHRYVLHAQFLYRHAGTARLWKRIHYDHHQNPHELRVLFGALYTTLPPIALITLPIGTLVGGPGGAAAAFAAGCLIISAYEFCHCVQHLPWTPKNRWLRDIKRRHLAHHFHSERGNYGITSNLWDRVFGTFYEHAKDVKRSETTYNLGYTSDAAKTYPWVAELSENDETYARLRRRRAA
jgi:sterol desaturase/sphingolipid hydroxylase (fatty acid hydroxylase superfamily)